MSLRSFTVSLWIISFLISFSVHAEDKTDYLLIIGHNDKVRYSANAKKVQETLENMGEHVGSFHIIGALSGSSDVDTKLLELGKKSNFKEIKKENDISYALRDLGERSSKNVTIFISNHGLRSSKDPNNFMKSGIAYKKVNTDLKSGDGLDVYEHKNILSRLKRFKNKKFIRIQGYHCYSGGIHEIAFHPDVDNVCTSASTSRQKRSTSGVVNGSLLSVGTLEEMQSKNKEFDFDKNGKTSLLEAHISGMFLDIWNFGRGQLSSLAYIDYVFEKGDYSKDKIQDKVKNTFFKDLVCKFPTVKKETEDMAAPYIDIIEKQIGKASNLYLSDEEVAILPPQFKLAYEKIIKSDKLDNLLKEIAAEFSQTMFDREKEIRKREKLKEEILELKESEYENRDMIIAKTKELREVYSELESYSKYLQRLTSPLDSVMNFFNSLKGYKDFINEANDKQKRKFNQLLECEGSTL